ncbi:Scr1 family TA system antitoxin-like transcriptional regulator [Streptomyces sp. H27-C3]|nr:Scr1 family TA system antitoxin-like transcriptional regulator [Streptomyces sp. H27-C3]MDJ0460840.1 Scr1 family TA system antitoxin-like transcriptional regulator [Streptomyces sp. H27-C3]
MKQYRSLVRHRTGRVRPRAERQNPCTRRITASGAIERGSASGVLRLRVQGGGGRRRGASSTDDNAGGGVAGRREPAHYCPRGRKRKKNPSWHLVGAQLGHFREHTGMTQPQLAERVCTHVDTIASIEQGRRPLQPELADRLDELLSTGGALAVGVEMMPERERYPVFAQDFIDYEAPALTLLSYETQVVPGLLQTEEYARAVFSCRPPPGPPSSGPRSS